MGMAHRRVEGLGRSGNGWLGRQVEPDRLEHGHVAQNWPFTLLEYWERTLTPDPADYDLID